MEIYIKTVLGWHQNIGLAKKLIGVFLKVLREKHK